MGLLGDFLPALFRYSDQAKKNIRGLLDSPKDTGTMLARSMAGDVQQQLGPLADPAALGLGVLGSVPEVRDKARNAQVKTHLLHFYCRNSKSKKLPEMLLGIQLST